MANTKISDLPSTTTLTNEDAIPVVQEGVTKKITGVLVALKTLLGIGEPSKLQTQSKEVVGAVNELNGKMLSSVSADYDCHVVTTGQQYIVANISSVHPQYEIAAVKMTEGNSTHVHDIYCFADGILATFEAAGDYKFHVVYFIKN